MHVGIAEADRLPRGARHVGGIRGGQYLHASARVRVVLGPTVGVVGGAGVVHLVPGEVVPAVGVQIIVVFLHRVLAALAGLDLPGVGVGSRVIAGVAVAAVGCVGVRQVGIGHQQQLVVRHVHGGDVHRGLMGHVDVEVARSVVLGKRAVAVSLGKRRLGVRLALEGLGHHQARLLGNQHAIDVPAVRYFVLQHVPSHGEVGRSDVLLGDVLAVDLDDAGACAHRGENLLVGGELLQAHAVGIGVVGPTRRREDTAAHVGGIADLGIYLVGVVGAIRVEQHEVAAAEGVGAGHTRGVDGLGELIFRLRAGVAGDVQNLAGEVEVEVHRADVWVARVVVHALPNGLEGDGAACVGQDVEVGQADLVARGVDGVRTFDLPAQEAIDELAAGVLRPVDGGDVGIRREDRVAVCALGGLYVDGLCRRVLDGGVPADHLVSGGGVSKLRTVGVGHLGPVDDGDLAGRARGGGKGHSAGDVGEKVGQGVVAVVGDARDVGAGDDPLGGGFGLLDGDLAASGGDVGVDVGGGGKVGGGGIDEAVGVQERYRVEAVVREQLLVGSRFAGLAEEGTGAVEGTVVAVGRHVIQIEGLLASGIHGDPLVALGEGVPAVTRNLLRSYVVVDVWATGIGVAKDPVAPVGRIGLVGALEFVGGEAHRGQRLGKRGLPDDHSVAAGAVGLVRGGERVVALGVGGIVELAVGTGVLPDAVHRHAHMDGRHAAAGDYGAVLVGVVIRGEGHRGFGLYELLLKHVRGLGCRGLGRLNRLGGFGSRLGSRGVLACGLLVRDLLVIDHDVRCRGIGRRQPLDRGLRSIDSIRGHRHANGEQNGYKSTKAIHGHPLSMPRIKYV